MRNRNEERGKTHNALLDQYYPTQVHLDLVIVILVTLDPCNLQPPGGINELSKEDIFCSALSFLLSQKTDGLKSFLSHDFAGTKKCELNVCFLSLSHYSTVKIPSAASLLNQDVSTPSRGGRDICPPTFLKQD